MEATTEIKEMEMTREQILQMQASARIYQKLYDDAYSSWGMRASAPAYSDSVEVEALLPPVPGNPCAKFHRPLPRGKTHRRRLIVWRD
jgi:hypothetical protein